MFPPIRTHVHILFETKSLSIPRSKLIVTLEKVIHCLLKKPKPLDSEVETHCRAGLAPAPYLTRFRDGNLSYILFIMPISAVIHLSPPEDVTLRPTMGHHAHAVFLSLLRIGNPKKAEEAHATSAQKPFTVSPLIARGTRHRDSLHLQAGTDCKLRFTFLSDALFAHFALVFFTHPLPSIRLGHATLQINRLTTTPDETDHWGSMTTYEELIETAETATHMQMRFPLPDSIPSIDTPRTRQTR